jgi:hypothetical protein
MYPTLHKQPGQVQQGAYPSGASRGINKHGGPGHLFRLGNIASATRGVMAITQPGTVGICFKVSHLASKFASFGSTEFVAHAFLVMPIIRSILAEVNNFLTVNLNTNNNALCAQNRKLSI